MDSQIALSFPSGSVVPPLPFSASREERAVYETLRAGAEQALQVPELAKRTGIPARQVQSIVEKLILEYSIPIGTSMRPPYGNFLIESPEDLEATVELLQTRGISNLVRAAALKKMTLRQYLEEVQVELELRKRRIA